MDNCIGKKLVLGHENVKGMFFWRFHTLLQENASQIFCPAPMMLKVTG